MAPDAKGDGPVSAVTDNREQDNDPNEQAFDDDDDDLDDDLVQLARIQSAKRREGKEKAQENRIQEILPFPFAPNIRPLGISDLRSVVALENAAFQAPQHRASPEKVGQSP